MKFECYLVVYLVLFEVDVSHKFSVWPRGEAEVKQFFV